MEIEVDYMRHTYTKDRILEMFIGHDLMFLERTFDIDDDIRYVMQNGVDKALEVFKNNPKDVYWKCVGSKDYIVSEISSSELPSKLSIAATQMNPVRIIIGFLNHGNYYDVNTKEIGISINRGAVGALGDTGLANLPELSTTYPIIGQEFSRESLYGSVAHELCHWLDDTYHDNTVTSLLKKYKSIVKKKGVHYFSYATNEEINANIQALVSLKRMVGAEKWDEMTITDMISLKPSLDNMFREAKKMSPELYNEWKKRFFKRMGREGLIGKNMREYK